MKSFYKTFNNHNNLESRMKKWSSLAIIILLLTLLPIINASAQETFVVSGNPNAPPVVWEEHEKLVGIGPDIITSIFADLGISNNLRRFGDWKNVQVKAREGKIDMLVSAYRNKERDEYLLFSTPYLVQPTVIVVEKGNEFKFSSWDALIGKRGVTNVGESYGQKFDDFIKKNLDVGYFKFERAIQLLNLGEADYLIVDLYTALIYTRLLSGEDAITILDPVVTVQDFHLAIAKNSALASRLPEINEKLKIKIKNGEITKSFFLHFDKWKRLIDRRAQYFSKNQKTRSAQQETYLKEQDEMARQRILGTMIGEREGLPASAE